MKTILGAAAQMTNYKSVIHQAFIAEMKNDDFEIDVFVDPSPERSREDNSEHLFRNVPLPPSTLPTEGIDQGRKRPEVRQAAVTRRVRRLLRMLQHPGELVRDMHRPGPGLEGRQDVGLQ